MLEHFGDIISSFGTKKSGFKNRAKSHFKEDSFDFFHLIRSWSDIAGEQIAKETIPLKIQNRTLTILTRHSIYAQQLSFLETEIIDSISKEFKQLKGKILRVTFQVNSSFFDQKLAQVTKTEEPKSTSSLNPFSPEYKRAMRQAEEMFFDIEDLEMRDSLKSIYIQNLLT